MKLHLPKTLLAAVLTALAAALPATYAGEPVNGFINDYYGYTLFLTANSNNKNADATQVTPGEGADANTYYALDGKTATDFLICADDAALNNNNVNLGTLTMSNGQKATVKVNGWDAGKNFASLTIGTLTVNPAADSADTNGAAALDVQSGQKVTINALNGTLSSTNAGTLTLGNGVNFSSITNNGTLKLQGTHELSTAGQVSGTGLLEVVDGGTLNLAGTGQNSTVKNNIKVYGGGVLNLNGSDTLGWGGTNEGPALMTLAGDGNTDAQRAIVNVTGKQTQATSISMEGYSHIKGGEIQLFGCNISASGEDNIITSTIQSSNKACEINVADEGSLEFTGNITRNAQNNGANGRLTKTGGGSVTFSGADGHFYNIYTHDEGITNFSGAQVYLDGGLRINGGQVNFDENNISLGAVIVLNGGILNLGSGTISLDATTLADKFDYEYAASAMADTTKNGFITSDKLYTIIEGYSAETVTGTGSFKLGEESITLEDGIYRAVGTGSSTTYCIGVGEVSTDSSEVSGATNFLVYANTNQETGTLVIKGDVGEVSASTILTETDGTGNIVVDTNITISGGAASKAKGKLIINDGVTLTVGAGSSDSSNISSFKGGVELAGGSLMINGAAQEVNSLTVSKASILGVANKYQGHQTYTLTGTTQLNADLEYTNSVANEHGDLVIKNLSGSGMLSTNGGTGDWGANALKVEKLTEYTGSIKVDGGNRDSYRNYVEFGTSTTEGDVTTKTSAFSTLKGLELTNKAYATVHSTGNSTIEKVVLNNGSLQYASDGGSYTYSLGDVTSDGASSISMDAGKAEITKLTLNSGTLDVTGSLTLHALSIDLSKYSTDQEIHTLVSAGTLDLGAGVNLSSLGGTVGNYTATVAQSGNTITLSLKLEDVTPTDWSLVGTPSYDPAKNMLTLNVGANLLDYDFTNNGTIIIPGIDDAMMKDILGLSDLPENGMVGITLMGGDGESVTATADQQIGFQGKDGIYYGAQVGSNWQYQVAYIPEPASATLGLAALMMLAARRRRND